MILEIVFSIVVLFFLLFIFLVSLALYAKLKLEPVRRVCTSERRLDGKFALVTGGNQGIGLETARDLASRGATVIIACRNANKSAEAIADIAATTGNTNLEFKPLDLSKFKSVRKFAESFNNSYDHLDILVINAGCAGYPKPTEDGIESVMQVNYFGHFLLTNLLLDKLIASKPSRIVIVSSFFHYFARLRVNNLQNASNSLIFGQLHNYGNSKLCALLWMKALTKRLPKEVTVNTLHPGFIETDILNSMPFIIKQTFLIVSRIFLLRSVKDGAQTTIYLCVSEEVENVRGKYFMDCKEAEYSNLADNDELVEQVWNKSLELTTL